MYHNNLFSRFNKLSFVIVCLTLVVSLHGLSGLCVNVINKYSTEQQLSVASDPGPNAPKSLNHRASELAYVSVRQLIYLSSIKTTN